MGRFYFDNYYLNFINLRKNIFFLRLKKPEFHNKHTGKKILIIGTGPSFYKEKEKINTFIKNNNPIVIAINNIPNDFKIDYRIFVNRSRFTNYSNLIRESQELILSPYFKKKLIYNYIKNKKYLLTYYKVDNSITNSFEIRNNIISFKNTPNAGFVAILSAYIMGSADINIAGIDGYYKNVEHHYYNETKDTHDINDLLKKDEYLIILFNNIKKFFDSKNILFNSITESKYNK